MKKIFLMALVALSMTAVAQVVSPLNISLADFKVDSLRTLYLAEPIMYRASLDAVAQALAKNADEIKAAKVELKTEQAHSKEMAAMLKEAGKMVESMKKLYDKEEAELKDMQKTVEKQQKTLAKQKELNVETREAYSSVLEREQKELGYSLRELADRKRAIADIETTLQNSQSKLTIYDQQLVQKADDLTSMEALLKERTANVKNEQKAAKAMK